MRKNTRSAWCLPIVVKKKRPVARSLVMRRHRSKILLSYPQSIEERPVNRPVHGHAISAFKSRDGAAGLGPDNSVDYAVVVTELAKTLLHRCNH